MQIKIIAVLVFTLISTLTHVSGSLWDDLFTLLLSYDDYGDGDRENSVSKVGRAKDLHFLALLI